MRSGSALIPAEQALARLPTWGRGIGRVLQSKNPGRWGEVTHPVLAASAPLCSAEDDWIARAGVHQPDCRPLLKPAFIRGLSTAVWNLEAGVRRVAGQPACRGGAKHAASLERQLTNWGFVPP